jgi:hypothetical protein
LPIYKTKTFKLSIAAFIILFIIISTIVNLNSYSHRVYEQSQKAFNIIDSAYKEGRELSDFEKSQLDDFIDLKNLYLEKYNKEEATKKEEKDVVLLYAVGRIVESYSTNMDKEKRDLFHKQYEEAKILLD